jgi:hypothetical protein
MYSADFLIEINFYFINRAYSFVLSEPLINTLDMENMSALGHDSDLLILFEIIKTDCALGILAE